MPELRHGPPHLPGRSPGDELPQPQRLRVEAEHEALHQRQAGFSRGLYRPLGAPRIEREGLLAQYVLPAASDLSVHSTCIEFGSGM